MAKKIRCTSGRGCYNIVDTAESGGSTQCETCRPIQKKRQQKKRVRTNTDVYDKKAWSRLSQKKRYNNPLCEVCESEGLIVYADVVDHIVEIEDGGEPFLYSNLKSMCHHHHNAKTKHQAKLRKEKEQEKATYRKVDDDYLVYG